MSGVAPDGVFELEIGSRRFGADPLPHEEIIGCRVDKIVAEWTAMRVQTTPVLLLEHSSGRRIVADGHHRIAAAQILSETLGGRPIRIAAQYLRSPVLLPAHRRIHRAPEGCVDRCRAVVNASKGMGAAAVMRALWQALPLECGSGEIEWSIVGHAEEAEDIVLVPALTIDEVLEIALGPGPLLPPRSTNFQPKPAEGSIRFALDLP